MQLVDSHAHLDMLDDPEAALKRARQAGVAQVVTIGIDLATSRLAADLAARYDDVFWTAGVHPHDAEETDADTWTALGELARTQGAVAIGECGLDFYRNRSPREDQAEAFAAQMALARELGLPLVIHDREAHAETLAMLKEHRAAEVGGVMHCFSGDLAFAKQIIDLGFHLGVTGVITFKNAQALRDLVKAVPPDRLLVETDCPFLAPVPYRGKDNEPAYVAYAAAALAEALGLDAEEAASLTTANTRRVFGLPEV